jgi:hypothetical protein
VNSVVLQRKPSWVTVSVDYMFLTVECPDELFADVALPAVMTGRGVQLEAVEDVPAGPWLAAVLDCIEQGTLSAYDLPAYLRACARVQAWAAAWLSDGVAELASHSSPMSERDQLRRWLSL